MLPKFASCFATPGINIFVLLVNYLMDEFFFILIIEFFEVDIDIEFINKLFR